MALPLIGAAARMAAKKLAEKGGKKAAKKEMSAEDARLVGLSGLSALGATNLLLGQDDYIKERDERKAAEEKKEQKEREAEDEIKRETRGMKSGGSVSPSKKVLAKSGFYDKGKTKSEREKIVGKVTTKPQRVKMVEKMLSTKKMKSGGSISARADGIAIRGKTKGRTV